MAKDAKIRAKARALYEAGQSFSQIADHVPASVRSMKMWCKAERWVKGLSAPELHRKEQAALEKAAEGAGLTKARVADKVSALMGARKSLYFQGKHIADEDDNSVQLGATSLAADLLGMKKQVETPDIANSILAWVRSQV